MSMTEFIKRPGTVDEYTAEEALELERCAQDPIYFINNYCYIQHQKLGKVKFKLRPYQEKIIKAMHENRYVVLLQPRQSGKCTSYDTLLTQASRPKGIKRVLLWVFFRKQYKIMFPKKSMKVN